MPHNTAKLHVFHLLTELLMLKLLCWAQAGVQYVVHRRVCISSEHFHHFLTLQLVLKYVNGVLYLFVMSLDEFCFILSGHTQSHTYCTGYVCIVIA